MSCALHVCVGRAEEDEKKEESINLTHSPRNRLGSQA
jgi:hypothetical protein